MNSSAPAKFVCPITGNVMRCPVTHAKTGISFEADAVMSRIMDGDATCPITKELLHPADLAPNAFLQGKISEWAQRQEKENDRLYMIRARLLSKRREHVVKSEQKHTLVAVQ